MSNHDLRFKLPLLVAAAMTGTCLGSTASAQNAAARANEELSEVVVIGQRAHYRGDVPVEELPQAVQVLDSATLEEIGVVKLNEALDLVSGVARQNTFGGAWDSFAIRGFAGDLNLPSGYLVNGFNGGRGFGGLRDTSAVERIEVMKGPGSALFGRGEPGGTVAIITKKPTFKTEGGLSMAVGSESFYRVEGDFTTPINDAIAVRVNGAMEQGDSFRDLIESKRHFASPSVLAKLGENTTLSYELEYSHQEIPFDRGVLAVNGVLGLIPNSRFLGEPGDGPMIADVLGHQLELQRNFSGNWALLVGAAFRETGLRGFGQNPEFAAARNPFFANTLQPAAVGQVLSRQRRYTDYDSDDMVGRIELSGTAETGSITQHLLMGVDYEKFELVRYQTRYRPPAFNATSTLATMNAVNIYNPVYGNLPAPNAFVFNDTEEQKAYGIYLTDQLDLTDRFKLRLGARYDWFKQAIADRLATLQPPQQDVTAFSPQVGLVYEGSDAVTLYAAYGKGFRPNSGFSFQRQSFEPEETTSFEVGMKFAAADDKIHGTVALYSMEKTNVLTGDPVNQGFTIAIGKAKSKGVEFDVTGELPHQFRMQLSYAFTDAVSASDVRDPDFGRVVGTGDPLINIPKHNLSALLFKDFDVNARTLTLGAGVKYFSSRLGETGVDFYLPGYTLVRAQVAYEVSDNFNLTGEVTNLFDKQYYPASYAALWVAPGAPRQFQIRANYKL